jgi:N6-adenosine-specific RNA methylase IME4
MYDNHPAADAFPMMDDKRYKELKEDIAQNGQRSPVILCDGMILDGRNRNKACTELGITCVTETFHGNPWAYVWSMNGARRDLVAEQRYLIWKFCSEQGDDFLKAKEQIKMDADRKRSEAAKERPRNETGTFQPVEQQSVAAVDSEHPEYKAKAAMSQTNAGAVARGDKLAKERPDLAKKVMQGDMKPVEAHRQMRKDEASKTAPTMPTGKYRVIYADPPWQYGDKRDGNTTGAEDHYPTMSIPELCLLPVPDFAEDNAVLFMWTTSPLLEDAFRVVNAWGFKYKTSFVWDKVKHNMGHYNSVRHEFLLVCTKGSCTPDNAKLFDSVQSIERTEHSRKPEEFRAIIDTLYTIGWKIEMFRRGDEPEGWDVWGNEAK